MLGLGAAQSNPDYDADEQRLRNVMGGNGCCFRNIRAGNYILDNERGINSFAAGHTRDDLHRCDARLREAADARPNLQGIVATSSATS